MKSSFDSTFTTLTQIFYFVHIRLKEDYNVVALRFKLLN